MTVIRLHHHTSLQSSCLDCNMSINSPLSRAVCLDKNNIITPLSRAIVLNPSPSSHLFAEQLTGTRLHHHTFFHSNCLGGNHTPSIAFRRLPPKEQGCRKPVFGVWAGTCLHHFTSFQSSCLHRNTSPSAHLFAE